MIHFIQRLHQTKLMQQALDDPRKRVHEELHLGYKEKLQALLVGMAPGTYVRPHRFPRRAQVFSILGGLYLFQTWDLDGSQRGPTLLRPGTVIHIDEGSGFHSWTCLSEGVLLEVLPGPHVEGDREYLPNSLPEDESPEKIQALVREWTKLGWDLHP